jgi:N-hydroxyarylamine O-acetyltransferase
MERLAGGRRHRLVDRAPSAEGRDGEVIAERTLRNAAELGDALREIFKITPPVPVEEIFDKTSG